MYSCVIYWIHIYAVLYVLIGAVLGDYRHDLLKDLLGPNSEYRSEVIPVKNPDRPIVVSIAMNLHQVRELNEKNQYLVMMIWLTYEWVDEFLAWNETVYGGIKRINLHVRDIWVPDIVLYNSVDEERDAVFLMPETGATIFSNGRVSWKGPAIIKSSCKVSVQNYPFDTQKCEIRFGPWTYNLLEVNVTCMADHAGMTYFVKNEEWAIVETPCASRDTLFDCCPEPYSDVAYTITMSRQPLFYLFNLVFPCAVFLLLGVFVFCLTPESGEKVSLGISVLLSMSVYQLIIMENIPHSSEEVPLLNKYFGASLALLGMSIVCAVYVLNWHFKGTHGLRPPRWVRWLVIGKMAKLLFMSKTAEKVGGFHKKSHGNHNPGSGLPTEYATVIESIAELETQDGKKTGSSKLILHEIRQYIAEQKEDQRAQSEWRVVARVMDRLFLVLFLFAIFLLTIITFTQIPLENLKNRR